MIIPGRRTAALAAVFAIPLLFLGMERAFLYPVLAGDLALLALYLLESRKLHRAAGAIMVSPAPLPAVRVGDTTTVSYTVANRGALPLSLSLRQDMPDGWRPGRDRVKLKLAPMSEAQIRFTCRSERRGQFVFPEPEVTLGRGGWFFLRRRIGPGAQALVHPAMTGLAEVERMRRGRGMIRQGLRRRRQVGSGSEFERLRAYLPDDDFRHVNWKNTARLGKPVTNIYQAEKGRDVLICIDCGRMMGQIAGETRVLDAAVEAGMILARAVAKEGDRPGFVAFRDKVENYIPVKSGKVGAKRVADAIARLEVHPVHTSFAALAAAIGARQNRRSLVVIFTDFNDPQLAEDLAAAMRLLRSRHAAIVVGMRDPVLDEVAAGPTRGRENLCRALAAATLAEERDTAALDLRKLGVEVVECGEARMAASAVERYLSVKAGRMLD